MFQSAIQTVLLEYNPDSVVTCKSICLQCQIQQFSIIELILSKTETEEAIT